MKTKQLIILLAVVVVLAAIATFKNHRSNAGWRESLSETATTMLPEDFDESAIYSINIKDNARSITMHRGDNGWTIADKYDYPANFKELTRFITDLTETKIAQSVPASDEQLAAMKLTDESGAVSVTLADKDGKPLKTITFGKKVEKESDPAKMSPQMMMYGMGGNIPLGRYVSMDGSTVIVANTFALVDEPIKDWFDSEFFKISDMKSATLSQNGTALWSVSRDSSSADLNLIGDIPADKELDKAKLTAIKSAFSWIRFNDVAAPNAAAKEIGMETPKVLTVIGFDDNIYKITFGSPVDGKQYIKVSINWNGATVRTPADDEKPEDKAKLDADFAKKVKESQDKAKELNDRLSQWTYEVGTNALSSVDKAFADFLKDKPKEEPKKEETKAEQ